MATALPSPRAGFMQAAADSLAAMHPHRFVKRGLPDLARLGNERLRQGVFSLVPEGLKGWTEFTGREGEYGTLNFAVLADGMVYDLEDGADEALAVEELEEQLEAEVLAWVQALKPEPLNAIYPVECTYSGGIEAPNAWVLIKLQALYV